MKDAQDPVPGKEGTDGDVAIGIKLLGELWNIFPSL